MYHENQILNVENTFIILYFSDDLNFYKSIINVIKLLVLREREYIQI
jgi:hypothetical protein